MYQNIGQGNTLGLGNVGDFANNYYWSSTEVDSSFATVQNFSSGGQLNGYKDSASRVRAVRAF